MAGQTPESTKLRMTRDHHDFMELVWENGQILLRGPCSNSPSCISYSSHSPKDQLKKDSEIITTMKPKLGTVDSILGDSPLGLPGPELVPRLYQTNFNMFLEENTENNKCEKHITDSHVVPVYKNADSRPVNESKFKAEIPQITQAKSGRLHQSSSLQKYQVSAPLSRSVVKASQTPASKDGLPYSKLKQVDSGPDKDLEFQNFSLFLRPAQLHKANGWRGGATRTTNGLNPSRLAESKGNNAKARVMLTPLERASGSKSFKVFQNQADPLSTEMNTTQPIAKSPEESAPDEQSEAVVHKKCSHTSKRFPDQVVGQDSNLEANTVKVKPDTGKSRDKQATTTSICSRGASNDPSYSLRTRYEDAEGIACPSENTEEEQVDGRKVTPVRENIGPKRKRTAEVHSMSERRRRDKINKKIRALKDLIPNANKVDKASILDEAIAYVKTLQLQIQIMSMGTGFLMPPMMLPIGMQYMDEPNLIQFSAIGMRMPMGAGCSPVPYSTASGFLGLPGQVFPMPRTPYSPFIGGLSTHSIPIPGATTPVDPLSSKGSLVQKMNSEMMNNMQASSQLAAEGLPHNSIYRTRGWNL